MTDCDQAQIAALKAVYPQSNIYLCTWHVLRTMRQHLVINEFPELWEKIQRLVNTDDLGAFLILWDQISTDPSVPKSLLAYLRQNWLPVVLMWSKTMRRDRSIYEEGDTNMLIEVYVGDFYL